MNRDELAARLRGACAAVTAAQDELTEIDSHFGDADHGVTMTKIAQAIAGSIPSAGGIKGMLEDAAMEVMMINGGSAVPLWNTWLDGLAEASPEGEELDAEGLKHMLGHAGLEGVVDLGLKDAALRVVVVGEDAADGAALGQAAAEAVFDAEVRVGGEV